MALDDTQYGLPVQSGQSTRRPDCSDSTGSPAQAAGGSRLQSTGQQTAVSSADQLSGRIDSEFGQQLTASTDSLSATLLGVPRIAVAEFVYRHQQDPSVDGDTRPSALFDIENTGSQPIRWDPKRTSFIGSDGYTYREAHLSLDPAQLGPGCHTRSVEIEPGCRARVMTLVERLPEAVEVAKVVHTVTSSRRPDQRLAFELR